MQLLPRGYLPQIFHREQRTGDIHHALVFIHRHFAQRTPRLLLAHVLVRHQHAFGFVDGLTLLQRVAQGSKLTGELLNFTRLLDRKSVV